MFAPSSRTVSPKSVLSLATGREISPYSSFPGSNANHNFTLEGNGSALVFDFGREVGGIVHLEYTVHPSGNGRGDSRGAIGLSFTEAKNWIGGWSDLSNGAFRGPDGALYSNFTTTTTARGSPGSVSYTMPDAKLRGGFRYLTLFLVTSASSFPAGPPGASSSAEALVSIQNITLEISFQPTWSNLRAYQGYFHSSDDTLNKIWYSGAYTLQTNAVPTNTGRRARPMVTAGWMNDGVMGPGDSIIVDGAKRDRAVWPGDMGVAVPALGVSTGDLEYGIFLFPSHTHPHTHTLSLYTQTHPRINGHRADRGG